jgi:RNA polymerase sigma factor (sigma-70 family)
VPEWPSLAEKKLFGSPASGHLIVQAAMSTDQELLQRYLREGSEPAFTEIVCRHVDLVYGTALRQLCGNTTLAQDVTQAVFTALAAKPAALLSIRHFSAWLYTTTRFTVSHTVRTERRRQDREQKAHAMHAQLADSASPDLPPIPPELFDQVMEELDDDDREAVLLRFFEGKPFATVGAALGVGEDAARMRVARALEKIRALFARHGITSSAAAVGAALAGQAVAAPAHLAASVSTLALAGTAAAQLGLLSSATLMTTATKAALALTGTLTVFAFGTAFSEHRAATARRVEIAALTQEQTRLTTALRESEHRASALAERATQAELRLADLSRKPDFPPPAAKLLPVAPKTPAPLTEERRALLARMAQMKPLLAAGQPIKGAIIVLVDDKPVQRPVEFVMGQETRFPVSDDGTYVVTPTLNEDGSVKYKIALLKSDPTTGQEKSATLSSVTHYPWGSFTLSSAGGKIIAFDPDKNEP